MKSTTYITEITTQKTEKHLPEEKNLGFTCSLRVKKDIFRVNLLKYVLPFLTKQTAQFFSCGISRSYFSRSFLLSFLLWYDFKIQVKSRRGGTFLCLALSVNVRQKHFFKLKAKYPSLIFLIWMEQCWIWFGQILTKKHRTFYRFLKFFKFYLCVWLSNLGSDLLIDNIVRVSSADTKMDSQYAAKKVLELTQKWKYPKFRCEF